MKQKACTFVAVIISQNPEPWAAFSFTQIASPVPAKIASCVNILQTQVAKSDSQATIAALYKAG